MPTPVLQHLPELPEGWEPRGNLGHPFWRMLDVFEHGMSDSTLILAAEGMARQAGVPLRDGSMRAGTVLQELLETVVLSPDHGNEMAFDPQSGVAIDRQWLAERLLLAGANPWEDWDSEPNGEAIDAWRLAVRVSYWRLALIMLHHPQAPRAVDVAGSMMEVQGKPVLAWTLLCQKGPEARETREALVIKGWQPSLSALDRPSGETPIHLDAVQQHVDGGWWPMTSKTLEGMEKMRQRWVAQTRVGKRPVSDLDALEQLTNQVRLRAGLASLDARDNEPKARL